MVFSTLTQRADGPSCQATTAPSVQGVRVSSPPDRTSTGRVGGTSGGCPEGSGEPQGDAPVDRVMGGSSRTGAGQWRQSSNSATGEVVHSWTENGAKVSSEKASTEAWYWAWRTASDARMSNACG